MKKLLKNISVLFMAVFIMVHCGGDNTGRSIDNVIGIPEGDKEGTGLSGEFGIIFEYTNNGCEENPALEVPRKGFVKSFNTTVIHEEGRITFKDIEVTLRGGVNFDNTYIVGGTGTLDISNQEENIVRNVLLEGKFVNSKNFTGEGSMRFTGGIGDKNVNCTVNFKVSGVHVG